MVNTLWLVLQLLIDVPAVVAAFLAGLDFFFALGSHRDPVLDRRIPVQVAVLNSLTDFELPRVVGWIWLCLVCRAHAAM